MLGGFLRAADDTRSGVKIFQGQADLRCGAVSTGGENALSESIDCRPDENCPPSSPMSVPAPLDPSKSFQGLILTLQNFWASKGCVILQPYDMEVGAGTFHPATTLRALGPKAWNAAYVQPSRRPKDGRYGENPNRFQHYYQYQVILKPSPLTCRSFTSKAFMPSASTRPCTTSVLSRMIGKAPRSVPGASAGNAGATAWR